MKFGLCGFYDVLQLPDLSNLLALTPFKTEEIIATAIILWNDISPQIDDVELKLEIYSSSWII
jgi:hypothetical protein